MDEIIAKLSQLIADQRSRLELDRAAAEISEDMAERDHKYIALKGIQS